MGGPLMTNELEPQRIDRRRVARRIPSADEALSQVRLRTGWTGAVIDLSHFGALIETGARLLPGTHVDVHVVTGDGRVLVRSRVIRACVCHLEADGVRYRGALAFEREIATSAAGYAVPGRPTETASALGTLYPSATLSNASS